MMSERPPDPETEPRAPDEQESADERPDDPASETSFVEEVEDDPSRNPPPDSPLGRWEGG